MSVFSDAIGSEIRERVLGYKIGKDSESVVTPNVPMRIAILCERNDDNQAEVTSPPTSVSVLQVTTRAAAAQEAGYGSPADIICSILFPVSGGAVGGIPVYLYLQNKAVGATTQESTLTVTGTATANVTHTVMVCGRGFTRDGSYDINIAKGDTDADVATKIQTALSNVLGCPVTAALNSPVDGDVNLESKWSGLTANDIHVRVETYGKDSGLSYEWEITSAGSGTPDINPALNSFGTAWNTIVLNSYGTVTSVMDKLEAYNGIPDPASPTGRYRGAIMKPFAAFTGSTADDPSAYTDSRLNEVTNYICPAPLSNALPMEAAANMLELACRVAQDTPELDVAGKSYRDMPVAREAIAMSDFATRDAILKKGCSTVDIVAGKYVVQSFVSTYHKEGENPLQFTYFRNFIIDINVFYTYYLLEQVFVVDHVLANDGDVVDRPKVIKPKEWKALLSGEKFALGLTKRALIANPAYLTKSIQVGISNTNPDRLAARFKYKRTSFARIVDTTAEAGFNTGN